MAEQQSKPNFLVFITDQQRADHLGIADKAPVRTPNIDRIAHQGTRFTSCYTSCPACMPARQTLFTGLTNRAQGVRQNGNPLPRHIPVLPAMLQDAGYRTYAAGKLHLRSGLVPPGIDVSKENPRDEPERHVHWKKGRIQEAPPDYYGVGKWDCTHGHGKYIHGAYRLWLEQEHPEDCGWLGGPMPKTERNPWWELTVKPEHHYNAWIADRTIDFLGTMTGGDAPFFAWCSFPDPHAPFAGLPKFTEHYRELDFSLPARDEAIDLLTIPRTVIDMAGGEAGFRRMVYHHGGENLRELYIQTFGMIEHVDEQVGRVMHALESNGQLDNTVVVFLSDHGDMLGEHGLMHKSYWPYDGCCRVPFIVRSPWAAQRGRVEDTPVGLIDFVLTILDWAGVSPPDDPLASVLFREQAAPLQPVLPGESLRPSIDSCAPPQRGHALIEFDDDRNQSTECVQMRVLVTGTYKLCFYRQTGECVLFDRRDDPDETRNLYAAPGYEQISREMLERLLNECLRTEARLPRRVVGS